MTRRLRDDPLMAARGVGNLAMSVPDRVRWAVQVLAVKPDDHLLEIGCGRGVAVSLICEQLCTGTITAIDRSAKMIRLAAELNKEHVASGRATLRTVAVETVAFTSEQYDKIFAINVNLFWVRPADEELDRLRRALSTDGAVYLLYERPSARVDELTGKLIATLRSNGFITEALTATTRRAAPMLCVIGRPA